MPELSSLLSLLAIIGVVTMVWRVLSRGHSRDGSLEPPAAGPAAPPRGGDSLPEIYEAISRIHPFYEMAAHPSEIEEHPALDRAVELLLEGRCEDAYLLRLAIGDNAPLRCAGFRAIEERGAAFTALERLLVAAAAQPPWFLHFALRAVTACAPPGRGVFGEVVTAACVGSAAQWLDTPPAIEALRDFALARREGGEKLRIPEERLEQIERAGARDLLGRVLERIGRDVTAELWPPPEDGPESPPRAGARDPAAASLDSLGTVWRQVPTAPGRRLLDLPVQAARVARLRGALEADPPRSCLLVGETGAGKRATVEALARELRPERWRILEAGHTDIIADQVYVGMFEARLRAYVRLLRRPRHLWYVPDFGLLRSTGRHEKSATGALQLLLPHLERGELRLVGALTPSAYEALVAAVPRVRGALDVVRVDPLGGEQTLDLARRWLAADAADGGQGQALPESDRVLEEAWLLADQFLSDRAAPGNLLQLLGQTRRSLARAGGAATFGRADLVAALAELTGLPPSLLDDRQRIDPEAVRRFFAERILGQDEAVDCLVQRVVMMKAGLTDPGRPQGVFLFAGPTGTGKTEIAKVLAEYLFGSPARLVRLDMSEFNVPGSAARLLRAARADGEGGGSLVGRLRQQPFAVVLLDEFEKSVRDVWDLFLQVADEGRLTDDNGDTVDFRHAIVILTSNLGAAAPAAAGLGFGQGADPFRPHDVERAIERTFRREFLNRLDRIVVFRPFTRETMRQLLQLEIRRAELRRGLRHREWATILDSSAVEFLLERGFTADLGARPLRRAVERHLLEPLAAAMARGRAPAGDRFLFVHREGDRLVTEFVDPDAPAPAEDEADAVPDAGRPATLQALLLDPRGGPRELAGLRACCERLAGLVASAEWEERKRAGLAAVAGSGFWESEERFAVLGRVENIDRVESGIAGASALLERLGRTPRERGRPARPAHAPRDLVWKLANSLFLLEAAVAALETGDAWDAYLLVEAGADAGQPSPGGEEWARRLAGMYERWARRRRMRRQVLAETAGRGGQPWRQVSAITGLAAHPLLAAESGLHVWEEPDPRREGGFRRRQALVRAAAQPPRPAAGEALALQEAVQLLTAPAPESLRIVRHYRGAPSPLVRDRVRGWRSGRLELVLEGAFDLLGPTG